MSAHSLRFARLLAGMLLAGFFSHSVLAVGTTAGREINNSAQANYAIGGVAQAQVDSNTIQVFVDELLDVVVVNDDGAQVVVSSPSASAQLQFTLTNTGNGSENFRLLVDNAIAGDLFDPNLVQIYLESNAAPGLQIGGGGDTVYTLAVNDPLLVADASLVVYVVESIPGGLNQTDQGFVELRAVSTTLFAQSGTDDPNNAAFPGVGTQYAGVGDLDELGGANVNAVVGTSHNLANLLIRARGVFEVNTALVTLVKSVVSVVDPFGGTTIVPGSVLEYQIVANVAGSGTAEDFLVTDVLPAELEYLSGSLVVAPGLPPGEEVDDDFAPGGTDNTGFDTGSNTLTVSLGDVVGGPANITITFEATIR